jgi:hypothetical protein
MKECCQQFVRMDNVAATFPMGVDDPTPAVSGNGAAITPRPPSSTELASDDFPVFHWQRLRTLAPMLFPSCSIRKIKLDNWFRDLV